MNTRNEIEKELQRIVLDLHSKYSWTALERKIGLTIGTLQNAAYGRPTSITTAIKILEIAGKELVIRDKEEK